MITSVGIDVGKRICHVALRHREGEYFERSFENNKQGLKLCIHFFQERDVSKETPLVLESTGGYHLLFAMTLKDTYHYGSMKVINGILTKRYSAANIRKIKTDSVDEIAKKLGKKYRWVYQYTAMDVATGIKCKMVYETHDGDASVDFLGKVRLFYPFPVKVIQTDNGFEFTWRLHPEITKIHHFTLQCQLYGYEHYLIPPAYPRANSHVERTHRIDEEEVYRGKTFTSLAQLHKVNLQNLKYFNEKRPQKTKHFLTPLKFGILKYRLHKQKLNYSVLNV